MIQMEEMVGKLIMTDVILIFSFILLTIFVAVLEGTTLEGERRVEIIKIVTGLGLIASIFIFPLLAIWKVWL